MRVSATSVFVLILTFYSKSNILTVSPAVATLSVENWAKILKAWPLRSLKPSPNLSGRLSGFFQFRRAKQAPWDPSEFSYSWPRTSIKCNFQGQTSLLPITRHAYQRELLVSEIASTHFSIFVFVSDEYEIKFWWIFSASLLQAQWQSKSKVDIFYDTKVSIDLNS